LFVGGCWNQSSSTPSNTPTTMPAPVVSLPTTTPPAAKDLTHVLTKDQPIFLDMPSGEAKPVGTLKEGSKVLVMVPGADYSQVTTDKGIEVYTATDGLKPLGK
jgi:hypothetical protein